MGRLRHVIRVFRGRNRPGGLHVVFKNHEACGDRPKGMDPPVASRSLGESCGRLVEPAAEVGAVDDQV
jgi:hypothetical protein